MQLQWGRRLSTPEAYERFAAWNIEQFASMGPASFNAGGSELPLVVVVFVVGFNGAGVFQRRRPVSRRCRFMA